MFVLCFKIGCGILLLILSTTHSTLKKKFYIISLKNKKGCWILQKTLLLIYYLTVIKSKTLNKLSYYVTYSYLAFIFFVGGI